MTNIDMLVADEARPALQQLATGQDIDGRRAAALKDRDGMAIAAQRIRGGDANNSGANDCNFHVF